MSTRTPVEALQSFDQKPLNVFAVTRPKWHPIIETAETFLATDMDGAKEIAEALKEELRILIGEEIGVAGSQERYDTLIAQGMSTVSITPVTIQAAQATN